MSQVCKYYLRGACKYGPRCHFLHEDPNYKSHRGGYSDYSYNNNYANKNYSQNYSHRNSYSNRDYSYNFSDYLYNQPDRDYSRNYPHQNYSYNQSNREYSQNYPKNTHNSNQSREHSNYGRDYHRYHVDHRQNQRETKSASVLTAPELLEVTKLELKQFEERHVWPLTVIAPVKEFGNIPCFRDYSPEEVRYQYYEAVRNNTLFDFEQNMKQIREDVMRCCQHFRTESAEARDCVTKMMLKPHVEEMATDFISSAASTFSFDLKKLQNNGSSGDGAQGSVTPSVFDTNNASPSVFSTSGSIPSFPINNQMFPSNNSPQFSIFSNQPSNQIFNVPSQFNSQPQSQINSFSFNLNNLNSGQNNVVPEVPNFGVSQSVPGVNEAVYSKLENLSPDTVEAFTANTFTFGRVPLVPPPKELCRIAIM